MKIKAENKIWILVGAVIILAALAFVFLVNFDFSKSDSDSFSFYDEDSCRCIEKLRPACNLDGFEWNKTRGLCVNSAEKLVTTHSFSCSVYECSSGNYEYNLETEKWEVLE